MNTIKTGARVAALAFNTVRIIFVTAFTALVGSSYGQAYVPPPRMITQQEAIRISQSVQQNNAMTYGYPYPNMFYPTWGTGGAKSLSKKYEFTVVLKIDSTFTSKTSIDLSNPEEKDYHKIAVKRSKKDKEPQVYYPIDTKSITRVTEDGQKMVGIPVDSCWLFKTASGKINCYSFLAEPGTPYVTAIQQGDEGKIIPLSKGNLQKIIGTDPKTQKLIEDGKLVKAIELYNKP